MAPASRGRLVTCQWLRTTSIRRLVPFALASLLPAAGFDTERELRTHLLQGYDPSSHPLRGTGSPTQVRLQVHVADLWSFDQKSMTFAADLYIRERWNDTRLRYSHLAGASQFSRVDIVRSTGSVWHSVLYFPAAIKETLSDELLYLYPDGSVWRSRRIIVELKCAMQFQAFPYDSQECPIRLESWSQTSSTMLLVANPPTGVESNKDNEWSAFSATQATDSAEYSTGIYSYSTVFIRMQREMLGWRKSAVVPVVIFVLVSYSGYWISPGAAPARVTLAIISVLITLTLWSNIVSSMPLVTYPVWLRDYIMGCVFFNLCSVFSYTVVNYGMQVRDAHKAKLTELKAQHTAAAEALHHAKTHHLLQKQVSTTHMALQASSIQLEDAEDLFWDVNGPPKHSAAEAIVKELQSDAQGHPPTEETDGETVVENVGSMATQAMTDADKALIAVENGASQVAMLMRIDWHMRWIFPVSFAIYNFFMFVVLADTYNFEVGS